MRHWLVLPLLLAATCKRDVPPVIASDVTPPATPVRLPPVASDAPDGLLLRLSEGRPGAAGDAPIPAATTTPLPDAVRDRLLARLPALPAAATTPVALRPASTPPPRPGTTVTLPFPAPAVAPAPADPGGAPKVLRSNLEGEVPIAPKLAVTFDRPMVALGAIDAMATAVPVRLEPAVDGAWRWLGTRTLVLEPAAGRLPQATTFVASVPVGTRAVDGRASVEAWTTTFATPPVAVLGASPGSGATTSRRPVVALVLDQDVSPEKIAAHLVVEVAGARVPVRVATSAEIAADAAAAVLLRDATPARAVAVVPEAPLPHDANVVVTLPKGAPSAEGPRTSTRPWSMSFRTYGPLRLADTRCGWNHPCRPGYPLQVRLTNPLDPGTDAAEAVSVAPVPRDLAVTVEGDRIVVYGATLPDTRYAVTVRGVRDLFGQTLEQPITATFDVTVPEPPEPWVQLVGPEAQIPDPFAPPAARFVVAGVDSVRVRVLAVTEDDWSPFIQARDAGFERTALPGRVLVDERRPTPGATQAPVELVVPLADTLADAPGLRLVVVERPQAGRPWGRFAATWVQVTRLGVTVLADAREAVIAVHDLQTGLPVANAEARIGDRALGRTEPSGLLRVEGRLPADALVVTAGTDKVVLSSAGGAWRWGAWQPDDPGTTAVGHLFDDRGLYRPGETVHVKGWIRPVDLRRGGDVGSASDLLGAPVTWAASDSQGVEIATGRATLDAWGGFAISLPLPSTPNLGEAYLAVTAAGGSFGHGFRIAEFRRPEFEVAARVETEGPHVVGHRLDVAATASYLAGGTLPGAPVRWTVRDEPASWSPPGWDGWTFGAWTPWWWATTAELVHGPRGFRPGPRGTAQAWSGRTDPLGTHRLAIDVDGVKPLQPRTIVAEATVEDVNRQAWTATTRALVHPATVYAGVKLDRAFVEADVPLVVALAAVGLDGTAVSGRPIDVTFARRTWKPVNGRWTEVDADATTCAVESAAAPVTCTFRPGTGGTWSLRVRTTDDRGRATETSRTVWVAGGDDVGRVEGVEAEAVTLVPDRRDVAPGEVVEVLAQLPFDATEALVTFQRAGLVHVERVAAPGRSFVVKVPVEEAHLPALVVQVDAVGLAPREGGTPRPAYASSALRLPIRPVPRTLSVTVIPARAAVAPGEATEIEIVVRDPAGRPVPDAQVVVAMVDEAVLALSGHTLADPLATFLVDRGPGVLRHDDRPQLVLAEARPAVAPDTTPLDATGAAEGLQSMRASKSAEALPASQMMLDEGTASRRSNAPDAPIAVRTDFRPDALWLPDARTDARGRIVVPVTVPDSLTRYRIGAVVADAGRSFGLGEAEITARLPVLLRPSPPRFLNFGDRAELPIVVQNQGSSPVSVDVVIRAANADLGSAALGLRATIPAGDRRELRVPVATREAGRAVFQVALAAGAFADATTFDLPVWTPATQEATATYGILDGPQREVVVAQGLDVPTDALPQVGGLSLDLSTTQLQALTDAWIYLLDYPYGCTEQIASRLLSTAALHDVLAAFRAPGLPDRAALEATVAADVAELARRQSRDGSWGWWRPGERGDPWLTLHATHALVRARAAGFAVDDASLARGLDATRDVERLFDRWWSEPARLVVRAQAVAIRASAGEPAAPEAAQVYAKGGTGLPLSALGWLLPTLHRANHPGAAEIRKLLRTRVDETASTAQWTERFDERESVVLLHSDRRTDAILLDAMLQIAPTDDLLPKVVQGLLGGRVRGRWASTQENAWVLLALNRYFRVAEGVTPDLALRAWVGPALVAERAVRGRSTETAHVEVPMAALLDAKPTSVTLARTGEGRAYYRLGLRYAPASLDLAPRDAGFTVTRRYAAVDDPADVRTGLDGTVAIRAGARVRVTLELVADTRRYHVALVDPLPAGLEVVDPGVATSGTLPPAPETDPADRGGWWWGPWYDHENLRDERVEAFARELPAGVWTYTYVARATTPGAFVVPPARAEEMYAPETFGRTGTVRVRVE